MVTIVTKCRVKITKEEVMTVSYHVRTVRGKPVFAYDSLERAKLGKAQAEKRVGCKMQIVRITQQEELIDA